LNQISLVEPNRDFGSRNQRTKENETLAEASSRTSGAIITCAPVLLEVIEQSLGARVAMLFRGVCGQTRNGFPPLVTLDDAMMASLEQLIAIITDLPLQPKF
jgi:hypothetical protein